MDEFTLIKHYFTHRLNRSNVVVGIGDDAAVVQVPSGLELVISTDTVSENIHFPTHAPPEAIGYKALVTSLSDLAAMGASPAWFTLSLNLPTADETWISAFSKGLFEAADTYNIQLIGGNTSRGPLSMTTQVFGLIPPGTSLLRSGAQKGDRIYVSGTLGNASYALKLIQAGQVLPPLFFKSYYRPTPRLSLGQSLQGIASAAIDISDGLIADLEHLAKASGVSAVIEANKLPIVSELQNVSSQDECWQHAASGGGDYELLFTVPPSKEELLHTLVRSLDYPLTLIGEIREPSEVAVKVLNAEGQPLPISKKGFQHF